MLNHTSTNIESGKVIGYSSNSNPIIKCGEEAIELVEVEPKVILEIGDYL